MGELVLLIRIQQRAGADPFSGRTNEKSLKKARPPRADKLERQHIYTTVFLLDYFKVK